MRTLSKIFIPAFIICLLAMAATFSSGCGVYSFRDVSIPDSLKSVRINYIDNRAPYVNPQLSPNLTERLRRKIQNQTRLRVSNEDNADLDVRATITDYSISTSGVSTTGSTLNRLTVTVQVSVTNTRNPGSPPNEFTVTRPFDFAATQSLQQAEAGLFEEMLRGLSDDIFNRLFSNW
jgi:outer membrane lipopolysaccharide assembly protein LptE/RlpB